MWEEVAWVQGWIDDILGAVVIGPLFYEEDFQIAVSFGETACYYAAC